MLKNQKIQELQENLPKYRNLQEGQKIQENTGNTGTLRPLADVMGMGGVVGEGEELVKGA